VNGGPGSPGSPSRQQSKILRGPTRRIGMEQKTASIQVKQVQVKHIERNVANIRATKEMHARDITGKRERERERERVYIESSLHCCSTLYTIFIFDPSF